MCMIKLQIHFWTLLFINALAKEINMLCHLQPQMYLRSPSIDGGMWAIILIFINALAKYINIYCSVTYNPKCIPRLPSIDGGMGAIILIFINALA